MNNEIKEAFRKFLPAYRFAFVLLIIEVSRTAIYMLSSILESICRQLFSINYTVDSAGAERVFVMIALATLYTYFSWRINNKEG